MAAEPIGLPNEDASGTRTFGDSNGAGPSGPPPQIMSDSGFVPPWRLNVDHDDAPDPQHPERCYTCKQPHLGLDLVLANELDEEFRTVLDGVCDLAVTTHSREDFVEQLGSLYDGWLHRSRAVSIVTYALGQTVETERERLEYRAKDDADLGRHTIDETFPPRRTASP